MTGATKRGIRPIKRVSGNPSILFRSILNVIPAINPKTLKHWIPLADMFLSDWKNDRLPTMSWRKLQEKEGPPWTYRYQEDESVMLSVD
jgi:hypothetical protein